MKKDTVKTVRFRLRKAFPTSDELGLDLLRLMATYNDLSQVTQYMRQPFSKSGDLQRAKLGFLYRLLFAISHEALLVISSMQGSVQFKAIKKTLTSEGQDALKRINSVGTQLRRQLAEGRNSAIFHYDRSQFREALDRHASIFKDKEEARSRFIFAPDETSYLAADVLRELIVFDFRKPSDTANTSEKVRKFIKAVFELRADMQILLTDLLDAYTVDRGLGDEFVLEESELPPVSM